MVIRQGSFYGEFQFRCRLLHYLGTTGARGTILQVGSSASLMGQQLLLKIVSIHRKSVSQQQLSPLPLLNWVLKLKKYPRAFVTHKKYKKYKPIQYFIFHNRALAREVKSSIEMTCIVRGGRQTNYHHPQSSVCEGFGASFKPMLCMEYQQSVGDT